MTTREEIGSEKCSEIAPKRKNCAGCLKFVEDMRELSKVNSKLNEQLEILISSQKDISWSDISGASKIDKGVNNNDLRVQLSVIQKKLRVLEIDSAREIKELLMQKDQYLTLMQNLKLQLNQSEECVSEYVRHIRSLENTISGLKQNQANELSAKDDEIIRLSTQIKSIEEENSRINTKGLTKLDEINTEYRKACSDREIIRNDYRKISDENTVLKSKNSELESKLEVLRKDMVLMQGHQKKSTIDNDELNHLRNTVERLNLTIHKECEERTELLAELLVYRAQASNKSTPQSSEIVASRETNETIFPDLQLKENKMWASNFKRKKQR